MNWNQSDSVTTHPTCKLDTFSLLATNHPPSTGQNSIAHEGWGPIPTFLTCAVLVENFGVHSPARDGDFHFGGRDVSGDRVEVVYRWHVLQLVQDVSLHQLHRQISGWLGSDPRAAQPGPDSARRVSGDSRDQIRDQTASGANGWGSHFTDVEAGDEGGRMGGGRHLVKCPWSVDKNKRRNSGTGSEGDCCASHGEADSSQRFVFSVSARRSVWREEAGYSLTHPSSSHTEIHSSAGSPARAPLLLLSDLQQLLRLLLAGCALVHQGSFKQISGLLCAG